MSDPKTTCINDRRRKKDSERIKELRLMDDFLMSRVFESDKKVTEQVLQIILEKDDLKVTEVTTQKDIKSVSGKSVRLDILAVDTEGRNYGIEVQRADKGAIAKRARYYSSMLDNDMLKEGQEFEELAETYVIFITENDVMGADIQICHIDRWAEEMNIRFPDGEHIIYVNGSYVNDNDDIGRLMHDFRCSNPEEMYFDVLAEKIKYFKNEGGRETMGNSIEDIYQEGREDGLIEGREEGRIEGRHNVARTMLLDGINGEFIQKYFELSADEIEELVKEENAEYKAESYKQ